ncbi:DUF3784 domain-containing protein [Mycoplasmatota bacterium WC44]
MWFYLITGSFLIFIGLLIHVFKMDDLIAGYNTMSKEQKENVDIRKVSKVMGICFYFNGFVSILLGIFRSLGFKHSIAIWFIVLFASLFIAIFWTRKYDYNTEGSKKKQTIIAVTVVAITIIFVTVLFVTSSKPSLISLTEEGIKVSGFFGDTYEWSTIEDVELSNILLTIKTRTNGSAYGSTLKGTFKTDEFGLTDLFVDKDINTFIIIDTTNNVIIINKDDVKTTKSLYRTIVERIK